MFARCRRYRRMSKQSNTLIEQSIIFDPEDQQIKYILANGTCGWIEITPLTNITACS